jgi:multiple sugar transport system permease protein
MTGGGPADATAIIGWYAYTEIFRFLNLGRGAALAIILALLLLGMVILYLRALRWEETS